MSFQNFPQNFFSKVKNMAFKQPFRPLTGCFWIFLEWLESCQAASFGLVSLRGLICEIIFGSLITVQEHVVDHFVFHVFSSRNSNSTVYRTIWVARRKTMKIEVVFQRKCKPHPPSFACRMTGWKLNKVVGCLSCQTPGFRSFWAIS